MYQAHSLLRCCRPAVIVFLTFIGYVCFCSKLSSSLKRQFLLDKNVYYIFSDTSVVGVNTTHI